TATTRHSAKGLEFEVVILVGMEQGKFPNYYALKDNVQLEESKRLCYVSVSRAKSCCILLRSEYYYEWGKRKRYAPSQYWNSIFQIFGNEDNSFSEEEFS
ncbi:MAG: ATP-binding domain-containing protein, partial [Flavobacterium piscis]|nr:ATP-binding domain-containing protein [Flavobacterium piscis]